MRKYILLIIFVLIVLQLPGQDKKEFKERFLEAEYFFLREEYEEAAFLYEELLATDPDNANLMFLCGASLLSAGKSLESIDYLERAVASISPGYREGSYRETDAPKEALFALAKAYHINENLESALEYYQKYKNVMQLSDVAEIEFVNKQMESINVAKRMMLDTLAMSYRPLFNKELSLDNSYNAVFAEGDSTLYFMSDKPFYSAILSTKFSSDEWAAPVVINGQLKADGQVTLSSVSYDGQELYVSKTENYDSDIYVSYRNGESWTPIEPVEEINTEYNETHASLNKNKTVLFFTSDRPGGSGSRDIYITERNPDGSWGTASNIGKPVNSLYSEESPFLSTDGKTLYFSSMGHSTMGGFDVFFSNKLPSGLWSYPANMGFPVSTTGDDLYYFPMGESSQGALYANTRFSGENKQVLVMDFQPAEVPDYFGVRGKIRTDDNAFFSEDTEVKVVNTETRDTVAIIVPDSVTGEYALEVPQGDYEINITSSGYDTLKEQVSVNDQQGIKEMSVESNLTPTGVSEGKYVVSKSVLFDFDSNSLSQDARFELEKLYKVMADNPELLIELGGHTDAKGSREYNLRLANRRAQSVIDYLVSKGISRERFVSKAYGEDKNLAINYNIDGSDNPEGRRFNRQVEINILNSESAGDIWLEEYLIPEKLKAEAYKKYYVILDEVSAETYRHANESMNTLISLYETERKNIYAAGEFTTRRQASEYLNELIADYPESRIVTEEEFQYLLKPVIQDVSRVKGPFTIQILAVKNPVSIDSFEKPEGITQIQSSDGIYRYIFGVYDEFEEASDKLADFVLEGYTDCFVLPLNRLISGEQPDTSFTENLDYYYTIQFSATLKEADPTRFKDLGEVAITHGEDGFYRYSLGIYLNKREAEIMLHKIKLKGFTDAFIKKISRSGL